MTGYLTAAWDAEASGSGNGAKVPITAPSARFQTRSTPSSPPPITSRPSAVAEGKNKAHQKRAYQQVVEIRIIIVRFIKNQKGAN